MKMVESKYDSNVRLYIKDFGNMFNAQIVTEMWCFKMIIIFHCKYKGKRNITVKIRQNT